MNILELFWKNSPLLLTITPSVYLYELCIPEGKIIKTILLTQNKTESFFHQQCEHRNSWNEI